MLFKRKLFAIGFSACVIERPVCELTTEYGVWRAEM